MNSNEKRHSRPRQAADAFLKYFLPCAFIYIIASGWLLLESYIFWVIFELLATALVAIGCIGEWYLHYNPGRKKSEKDKHHKHEGFFIGLVMLGVLFEFISNYHSINEANSVQREIIKANDRANLADKEAIIAQKNFYWLSAEIGPRDQKLRYSDFLNKLNGKPKFKAKIFYLPDDPEAQNFAFDIQMDLTIKGWTVWQPEPLTIEEAAFIYNEPIKMLQDHKFPLTQGPLTLYSKSIDNPPGHTLSWAFVDAKFNLSNCLNAALPDDLVVVIIGKKDTVSFVIPPPKR